MIFKKEHWTKRKKKEEKNEKAHTGSIYNELLMVKCLFDDRNENHHQHDQKECLEPGMKKDTIARISVQLLLKLTNADTRLNSSIIHNLLHCIME